MKVTKLLVEYLANPIGVSELNPCPSWLTETDQPGWKQGAYQVRIWDAGAKHPEESESLWDTGKVASDCSVHVE